MDEYTAVACSACKQGIYIAIYKLSAPVWVCPSCGAANRSDQTTAPVAGNSALEPSRFGPRSRAS